MRTISALPRQFRKTLDKHTPDEEPVASHDAQAAWAHIISAPLKELLSTTGARLADPPEFYLPETEPVLPAYPPDKEAEKIADKDAFASAFAVPLLVVIALFWASKVKAASLSIETKLHSRGRAATPLHEGDD